MPASICHYMLAPSCFQYIAASSRGAHSLKIIVQPADGNQGLPGWRTPPVQSLAEALSHWGTLLAVVTCIQPAPALFAHQQCCMSWTLPICAAT